MASHPCGMLFFLAVLSSVVVPTQQLDDTAAELGETRWAVLVAGSWGYENYRHQADVCHAYQILKKGGLKDENIIVFMYDDIAFNENNPRPGIIINRPNGEDVYHGVPKDYTGKNATLHNLFSVILGNQSAVVGGSGKVLNSGPNDRIFIYYVDHGSPGIVGMPSGENLYAKDLIKVLKRKHKKKAYKSMVFYLEACESGSMFEGLLSPNLNIYAVTASNASENSWAIYCPSDWPRPSEEYSTCLGDLFSVAWMEDSDLHDLRQETLEKQYKVVRRRTLMDNLEDSSHVMQYGDMQFQMHSVSTYLGTNPQNDNYTFTPFSATATFTPRAANQRDASLLHFWHKLQRAPEGSNQKVEAHKKLQAIISHRRHVDETMHLITKTSFGEDKVSELLNQVRRSGQPLVDNWSCLKKFVGIYERHCGALSWYGKKYARALANMCNAGISADEMTMASARACNKRRLPSTNDSQEYVLDK